MSRSSDRLADALLLAVACMRLVAPPARGIGPYHSTLPQAGITQLARSVHEATERERLLQSHEDQLHQILSSDSTTSSTASPSTVADTTTLATPERRPLGVSSVPASRLARLWEYGNLAVGLGVGAAAETLRRTTSSASASADGSVMLNEANIVRLVRTLSRMRGAALKLGQMLSIQDTTALHQGSSTTAAAAADGPLERIGQALTRLQNAADAMPAHQLHAVMRGELGAEWRQRFVEFEEMPFAAASIGQVHRARVRLNVARDTQMDAAGKAPADEDGNGDSEWTVAVKVQYPGVDRSIQSDLDNLAALSKVTGLLPKGLYLDNTVRVAKQELADEVDYLKEAQHMDRFSRLLKDSRWFRVPRVVWPLTTRRLLVAEMMPGIPIGQVASQLDQSTRDRIGTRILELCLRELFEFKCMQTDPNWSNFMYHAPKDEIILLDFGATRHFKSTFTEPYSRLLMAAVDQDKDQCIALSQQLGFLTGDESPPMISAHLSALLALAVPFQQHRGRYDFGKQQTSQQVRNEIPTMLKYRLTPPPDESYALHRKLSGAFLLCIKLKSRVDCHGLFERHVRQGHRRQTIKM